MVEIQSRDYLSRLLTGLIAASRGHRVFIGSSRQVFTRALKKPGRTTVYHDKSVNVDIPPHGEKNSLDSRLIRHQALKRAGIIVTSIDEEGGFLGSQIAEFVEQRFPYEALGFVDRLYFWGKRDFEAVANRLEEGRRNVAVLSGSPRFDLLRPEISGNWSAPHNNPYILVSSNLGLGGWSVLEKLRQVSGEEHFTDDASESTDRIMIRFGQAATLLPHFRKLIHELQNASLGLDIVVRPHPTDEKGLWEFLVGEIPSVFVDSSGSSDRWVANASAVIHNGCTLAVEAALSGTPVISFIPDGTPSRELESNRFGYQAKSQYDVLRAVESILVSEPRPLSADESSFFTERIFLPSGLAAQLIVEDWEHLSSSEQLPPSQPFPKREVKIRHKLRPPRLLVRRKPEFPGFEKMAVKSDAEFLSERLGIAVPPLRVVHPQLIEIVGLPG